MPREFNSRGIALQQCNGRAIQRAHFICLGVSYRTEQISDFNFENNRKFNLH